MGKYLARVHGQLTNRAQLAVRRPPRPRGGGGGGMLNCIS